jgi:hypothetical protein
MPRHPKPVWTPGASFIINPASPQAQGLLGWWPELAMRGTRTYQDRISYNHGSPNDVQITLDLDAERGWAWRFPYINNTYVEVPRINASLDIGAGSYTVSLWVYLESGILATSSYVCVATMRDSANYTGWILALYPQTDATHPNKLLFGVAATHAGPYPTALANATFPTARWVHVAGVVDRKSQIVKLYLDGVPQTTTASIAALGAINGTKPIRLGYESGLAAFKGRQSDLRIYGRALSDQEIYQLYAPETRWDLYRSQLHRKFPLFPQPETHRTGRRPQRALAGVPSTPYRLNPYSRQRAGLVGCWALLQARGCNNVIDLARNQTAPFTNTPVWQPDPELGYVLKFNGEGASNTKYLALPNTATVGGLDEVTVAVWYKPTANPTDVASYPPLWFESTGSTDYTRFGIFHISNTSNLLVVVRDSVAGNTGSATVNTTLTSAFSTLNVWYHVVVTYSAVQDRLRIYLNGVLRSTVTGTYGTLLTVTPSNPISLGGIYGSAGQQRSLTGCLGLDARMYSRELSAAEVYQLYAPETRWDLYSLVKRMSLLWTEVVTSTLYYQALTATVSQVGSVLRGVYRILTGSQSETATVSRQAAVTRSSSQAQTAGTQRQTAHSSSSALVVSPSTLKGAQVTQSAAQQATPTLTFQNVLNVILNLTVTGAGTVARWVQRTLTGTQASSSGAQRSVAVTKTASQGETATLPRQMQTAKSTSSTSVATTARSIGWLRTAMQSQSVLLSRVLNWLRSATQGNSATASRHIQVTRNAAQTGVVTSAKHVSQYQAASASEVATSQRQAGLARTALQSSSSIVSRGVNWLRTASQNTVTSLTRFHAKILSAAQTILVELSNQGVILYTLSVTLTTLNTLQRSIMRVVQSTTPVSSTVSRAITRTLTAVAAPLATVTRQLVWMQTTSSTPLSTMLPTLARVLTAVSAPVVSWTRSVARTLYTNTTLSVSRVRQLARAVSVTASSGSTLLRQSGRILSGSQSVQSTLSRLANKTWLALQGKTATANRAMNKSVTRTQSSTPTVTRSNARTVQTAVTQSTNLVRRGYSILSSSAAPLGNLLRHIGKSCSQSVTLTAVQLKSVAKTVRTSSLVQAFLAKTRHLAQSGAFFFQHVILRRRNK